MTDHPITPPSKLVTQWLRERPEGEYAHTHLAIEAARWGAEQELEALLTWLRVHHYDNLAADLLAARRPKPPSLKEQAIGDLHTLEADLRTHGLGCHTDTIRRALAALSDE